MDSTPPSSSPSDSIEAPPPARTPGIRRSRASVSVGIVAGFVRHHDRWVGAWVVAPEARFRHWRLESAKAQLVQELAIWGGGEALTRRNMVVVDGICRDGRELIESFFGVVREQQASDQA